MAKKRTRTPSAKQPLFGGGRKRVLVLLFVPSVARDGLTPIDQPRWVDSSLKMLGRVFGGATAYAKAKGIWRDDERGGALASPARYFSRASAAKIGAAAVAMCA
jgi:hypothetical protein